MNTILWTKRAKEDYEQITDYLLINWGVNTTLKFEQKVDNLLKNLEQHKFLCPASSQKPELRCCVINKSTSMAYEIVDSIIFIVTFFDNRSQNDYN